MNAIASIAWKEFKDGLRNRWIVAITLVFALLSVGISWFGAAASGVVGFTSLPSTIVSLASLAVFLIPLIALLLAYDAIVGEDEDGTLLLLLTYPLSKGQLLIGKLLGHGAIMTTSTILGFGASAVTILVFAQNAAISEVLGSFSIFILSASLLGIVFIAFAYLISAWVSEKSKAAGLALIFWFMFVLVFDLGLLGLLVATEGRFHPDLIPYLLMLNPTDVFRLINLVGFEGSGQGLLVMAGELSFGYGILFSVLIAWVVAPFFAAYWVFRKRRI
ncbi:MAG: ABC transporter permease subunit [Hahellaceae bacterium]|nr:ABC transporter permease subunit [Hahellaceae bacterium]